MITALVIQAALNAMFLTGGYFIGKHVEGHRRDEIDQAMRNADMMLDERARRAEGANVIHGPWWGDAA
jgi:uncharacterized protein YdgA (DUF945 family)